MYVFVLCNWRWEGWKEKVLQWQWYLKMITTDQVRNKVEFSLAHSYGYIEKRICISFLGLV
jgi:hypothetical protein